MGNSEGTSYEKKALRAGDAHSHEDEECRKRPTALGARMCRGTFLLINFYKSIKVIGVFV